MFSQKYASNYLKTQNRKDFAEKTTCVDNSVPRAVASEAPSISPLKVSLATARGTELKVVRTGRKFSGGGVRLKKGSSSGGSPS
jgi:hypothetical protein